MTKIEFPGGVGLCIEASSTVTGTVNRTRDQVGTFNSISLLSADFQELWERIKHRTRNRVHFETAALIERALSRIRRIGRIRPPRMATTVVEV